MRVLLLILFGIPIALFARMQAEGDSLRTYRLEEIVVTAARRGGDLLRVPLAASIVDAKEFASSRRLSLSDALVGVPGVLVQSRAGAQDVRLSIRGFGARGNGDRSNAGTIRGIKVLVDGIPETEPDGRTSLDLVDLGSAGRLEVIRSNVSTLFGNASGGIINVETRSLLPPSSLFD